MDKRRIIRKPYSFRGRMIGVPIGMIGGVELILLSIFLSVCWQQGDGVSRRSWNTF